MARTFKTVLASTAIALATILPATAETTAGSPITMETLVDHAEMIRVADTIDAAVDAKDWALARSLFTDEIRVDFTSLIGGEPATIPADGLIAGWSGNLTEEKESFHLRGNHRITFEADGSATMVSHGYAWNKMERGALAENGGNALWEVWGTYEHSFVQTEAGWRVDGMSFFATAERGNDFVRNTPGS
ncbi:nuclear transport factor 2 family protein [Roseobacter sp.]|uniref:nuclear transport factor 2 family protein n=1 Tax=Roseobacter sp. TaxID=1907202 RepID=UPI00262DB804|nr:nuclear transport factor 2 family protein [Roseobacter sp.]MDW3182736.1 nuclear transport factor 2 family protein [Roseobacter sp.]